MAKRPCALIIDSIQTMRSDGVMSAAGSVTMVKETAARLLQLAKGTYPHLGLDRHPVDADLSSYECRQLLPQGTRYPCSCSAT